MSQNDFTPPYAAEPPAAPYGSPAVASGPQPSAPQQPRTRNAFGLVALILAVVGAVFAMIPGALIVGWILLPVSFVLAIVALCMKGRKKGTGIAALIVSVVGTIIGVVVFVSSLAAAVVDAADEVGTDSSASAPVAERPAGEAPVADDEAAEDAPVEEPAPAGLGDTVVVDDFEITVTSVETGVPSVGNEYVSEEAQGAFTLLSIDVTNTGNSAETVISSGFTVRDPDGREFEASATASIYLEETGFVFEQVNPGNTASGVIVFDLPADIAPQTLEFQPGLFGGETAVISLQ